MLIKILKREKSVVSDKGFFRLTPKEYGILDYLMAHPNELKTPEEIYENVWNDNPFACRPVISVHMRHLREKIESDPSKPDLIKVRWGKGYVYTV